MTGLTADSIGRLPDRLWKESIRVPLCRSHALPDDQKRARSFYLRRCRTEFLSVAAGPDPDPVFARAFALYADDSPARDELDARLIAGQSDHAIVLAMLPRVPTLSRAVTRLYHHYFFNVRDRLAAIDWLTTWAIGAFPGMGRAVTRRDVWLTLALDGGIPVLETMLESFHNPLASPQVHEQAQKGELIIADYLGVRTSRKEVNAHYTKVRRAFAAVLKTNPLLRLQLKFCQTACLQKLSGRADCQPVPWPQAGCPDLDGAAAAETAPPAENPANAVWIGPSSVSRSSLKLAVPTAAPSGRYSSSEAVKVHSRRPKRRLAREGRRGFAGASAMMAQPAGAVD